MKVKAESNSVLPLSAFALTLAASGLACATPTYVFTNFDGPGQNAGGTTVNAINDHGAVVGFSSNNAANPFLLTNFIRAADGTTTFPSTGGAPLANANGINDANTVAGTDGNSRAFVVAPGQPTPTFLPAAEGPGTTSEVAFGINNANVIVGQEASANSGTTPGFVYRNGAFTLLNPVANAVVTNAQAINNNGLVAGFYSTDAVHQHGFLYDTVNSTYRLIADPVVANLLLTQFLGINDNDIAVGYWQDFGGSQHGFLYDIANGQYSFLDDPDAALTGPSITQITGINDHGEIAGFYVDAATGLQRGFVGVAAAAVPEPATLALVAAGLAACVARRRGETKRARGG